jgi:very-short-patch-repair endonuclease
MKKRQIHNRNYLKERRSELRNGATSAEIALWIMLKSKKLHGRKFRRQHSIENYIVDFYCPSENLIIELDGSVHDNPGQSNADYDRDNRLTKLGFKVIRIENESVFVQPESVLQYICSFFHSGYETGNYPQPLLEERSNPAPP